MLSLIEEAKTKVKPLEGFTEEDKKLYFKSKEEYTELKTKLNKVTPIKEYPI